MKIENKKIFVIAGPNGSGKTTTAQSILPHSIDMYEYINADEIAKGLAPLHPESVPLLASKLMIARLKELLELHKNFAFETTAAGKNYIKHLKKAQDQGYEINMIYLWLANEDLAIKRVAHRVAQGGHHIPEEIVRRRYQLGLENVLKYYLPLVDNAILLDNSNMELQRIIASKNTADGLMVEDAIIWEKMQGFIHD